MKELKDIDSVASLPPEMQDKAAFFMQKVLEKKPFDVYGVPEVYARRSSATCRPPSPGTTVTLSPPLYPKVDLGTAEPAHVRGPDAHHQGQVGRRYPSAGLAILYAKLARIVLWDGKITVLLAALWILIMHYLDFARSRWRSRRSCRSASGC